MTLPISQTKGIHWPSIPNYAESCVLALLHQFEQTQWWPEQKLLERQLQQLDLLLDHFRETSAFMRERLNSIPQSSLQPMTLDLFREIQPLSRSEIQIAGEDIFSTSPPSDHGEILDGCTSGSMGKPVSTKHTELGFIFHQAFNTRSHLWHNRDFKEKFASISTFIGAKGEQTNYPKGLVEDSHWAIGYDCGPTVILNCANCTLDQQLEWLLREQPAYLISFPSNLEGLAILCNETGTELPWLKEVISVSEAISPELRQNVETQFGLFMKDTYSTTELGFVANQCPEHNHYHVNSENVLVEILDESGDPCPIGKVGRLVVTDLHNFVMPLIRYDIEDMAEWGEPCPCGRGLPVIDRIYGRRRNFLLRANGDLIFPYVGGQHHLSRIAPISQIQVIQRDFTELEVILVTRRPMTVAEEHLVSKELNSGFGGGFSISFKYVKEIPRPESGKFEDFVCQVNQ